MQRPRIKTKLRAGRPRIKWLETAKEDAISLLREQGHFNNWQNHFNNDRERNLINAEAAITRVI